MDERETPGILFPAYGDLRGRITKSRQATIGEISARVVSELTKRLPQTEKRVDDELATLRARLVRTETLLRGIRDHPIVPPPAPVAVEPVHTNTDYRRNSPRAAPTTTLPMALPIAQTAPNSFTFDALTKVHTQLPTTPETRPPQVPRVHPVPTYHMAIEVPTTVPGLDPKRTLLSPFNDVDSYEAYRIGKKTGHVRRRKSRDPSIEGRDEKTVRNNAQKMAPAATTRSPHPNAVLTNPNRGNRTNWPRKSNYGRPNDRRYGKRNTRFGRTSVGSVRHDGTGRRRRHERAGRIP